MKIVVASDHVGYALKQPIIDYLSGCNMTVVDAGPYTDEVEVDYPDYVRKVAAAVSNGNCDRGIVICGTGVGASVAANKFPGIRAVLCENGYIARESRIHNDSNVIAFGALVTTPRLACEYLDIWLSTKFEGGRHVSRLAKLDAAFSHKAMNLSENRKGKFLLGVPISPRKTVFGPLMYAGDLLNGLRRAAEIGFDTVELSMRYADDLSPSELKSNLKEFGVQVGAIATGQSCLHDGFCLLAANDEQRTGAVERIKGHIEFAAELGAKVIIGGIRGKMTGDVAAQAAQKSAAIAAIADCDKYARKQGVGLLLEPINRYETNWINTIASGLEVIESIGSDNIELIPDTYHMNIEERDIPQAIIAAEKRIGYIHFADSNRLAPGQGHIDFTAVLRALVSIGFTGIISTEIMPLPSDDEAMQQAFGFLHNLLTE